tara:strand:+ start:2308 stop:3078 length:771 start_codon:yes stop_codon:yes gene_type:complete
MAAPFRTYLDLCNTILRELNEVELTSTTFTSALGIQKFVKDTINRAYFDICNAEDKWNFLSVGDPLNDYYGNAVIETAAGTRWYDLQSAQTLLNQYSFIDYDNIVLTEEGVSGKTAPFEVFKLQPLSLSNWQRLYGVQEAKDKSDTQSYGIPRRVIRGPANDKIGFSPIPDGVYKIYFYAYAQPTELTASTDTVVFPKQYTSVLLARARYYVHQFKDNMSQAQLSEVEFQKGLRTMREQLLEPFPVVMDDRRSVYV